MPTIKPKYTVFLKDSEKTQKYEAETIAEGLAMIQIPLPKGPYKLKVSNGKKETQEKLLYPPRIKRIMINKIYRAILEKQFMIALGELKQFNLMKEKVSISE